MPIEAKATDPDSSVIKSGAADARPKRSDISFPLGVGTRMNVLATKTATHPVSANQDMSTAGARTNMRKTSAIAHRTGCS